MQMVWVGVKLFKLYVLATIKQPHASLCFCIVLGKKTQTPKSKCNPSTKCGGKETRPVLMLAVISYDRTTWWKKTCVPLEWEDDTGRDLFSTDAQSESPATKFGGFCERKQAVLFFTCWVFAAVHILVPKIVNKSFASEFNGAKVFLRPAAAAAASANHAALVNWCVPGFAHRAPQRQKWVANTTEWVIFVFSQLQVKLHHNVLREGFFTEKQILKCESVCQYFLLID